MKKLEMVNVDDVEVINAIVDICAELQDRVYIAEDMADAIRDGFIVDKHPYKILSDERVVWIATK